MKTLEELRSELSALDKELLPLKPLSLWERYRNWVHDYPITGVFISTILSFTILVPIANIMAIIQGAKDQDPINRKDISLLVSKINLLETQQEFQGIDIINVNRDRSGMTPLEIPVLNISEGSREIGASMMGSTYLNPNKDREKINNPDKDLPKTLVLGASLTAISKDKKTIYGAIADGYGHSKTESGNRNIAQAAFVAVTTAVKKMSEEKMSEEKIPANMQSKAFVDDINLAIYNSFEPRDEEKGQASLCYYKAEQNDEGNIVVTATNIGDTMMIAYSPSTKEWYTLSNPNEGNPALGFIQRYRNGNVDRSYKEDDIINITTTIPNDSIIVAMTDGVHDYLTWKESKEGNKDSKSLDTVALSKALGENALSALNSSKNPAGKLLKLIRNFVVNKQLDVMEKESKNDPESVMRAGDDFTAHAIQPFAERNKNIGAEL